MAETVGQVTNGTAPEVLETQRTFTQAELNDIVQARLTREREKFADYDTLKEKAGKFDAAEEASKSELQKATERADKLQAQLTELEKKAAVETMRNKIASETGVPASLLTADTEEACKEQAAGILSFAKPAAYPEVKDGGEVAKISGSSTRDLFAQFLKSSLN